MPLRQTLKWSKNVYGGGAQFASEPEGNSESYRIGALVVYSEGENGMIEVARTSGVPDSQFLYGLAQQDAANNTANLNQDYLIPRPGDVFECALASAEGTVVAPTQDSVGDRVGLIKLNDSDAGGSGVEYVADTGNTNWAKIIKLHPQDVERRGGVASLVAGDRVLIQFLGTILDSDASVA